MNMDIQDHPNVSALFTISVISLVGMVDQHVFGLTVGCMGNPFRI
jgi:hypothetical protein